LALFKYSLLHHITLEYHREIVLNEVRKLDFSLELGELMLSIFISILFLSLNKSWAQHTPALKECFSVQGVQPWKYCIHTPAGAKKEGSIAYHLHGRNLDENTWSDETYYTSMIQDYWEAKKISPPTVVSVSFGPVWLLIPKGEKDKSGLSEFFINNVLPEVEKRLGKPKERILFGESMGGLNSIMLGLQNPQFFKKVASLCPAVYTISPFDSLTEIQTMIQRTGADEETVMGVVQLAQVFFTNDLEWQRSAPLQLIEKINPQTAPKFYLSCGFYDKYGNFEGNKLLAERAQLRGIQMDWHPLYGGHCVTDINSIPEFLAN
jgi:pimeloyl-ACP methyl ester carboxylesterase